MATMYPDYRRTPRMIYDMPEDKVSLSFPAQESEDIGSWTLANYCTATCYAYRHGACCIIDTTWDFYYYFNFNVFNDACHIDMFNILKIRKEGN